MTSRQQRFDFKAPRKASLASGKLPVAAPASFQQFCVILVMHICRKVLLVNTNWRVAIYLCGVTVVSLITDLVPVPPSYFSNKYNIFNQYFVKLGLGWTTGILLFFIYFTSNIYCCRENRLVQRHFYRLLVAVAWWFFTTGFFNYITRKTAFCTSGLSIHADEKSCKESDYLWLYFDPSGHAFLLVYCVLVISEEVKCLKGWERIAQFIKKEEEDPTERLTEDQFHELKTLYTNWAPHVRVTAIALTCLTVLWDIMLISTVLYFHVMTQKLIGVVFATFGWFITYKVWYNLDTVWSPPRVGQGLFKFLKD